MAKDDDEKEEAKTEEPPKKKGGKLIFIIIGVVVLLIGAGAFFLLGGEKEKTEGEEEKVADVVYQTVELRPFIVNLADNTSYLKVTLLLEYDPTLVGEAKGVFSGGGGSRLDPISGNLPGALKDREPMIRDAVIGVISTKTRQELLTAEGKEALKEELLEAMNDASGLDEASIVGVYFLEFVIQ